MGLASLLTLSLCPFQTKRPPKDLHAKEVRNVQPAQTSDGHLTPRRQIFTHPSTLEEEEHHAEHSLLSLLMNFNQCQAQQWLALYFHLKNCWTHTHTQSLFWTHSSATHRREKWDRRACEDIFLWGRFVFFHLSVVRHLMMSSLWGCFNCSGVSYLCVGLKTISGSIIESSDWSTKSQKKVLNGLESRGLNRSRDHTNKRSFFLDLCFFLCSFVGSVRYLSASSALLRSFHWTDPDKSFQTSARTRRRPPVHL